jgi:transcriptional antiterminator RfaH
LFPRYLFIFINPKTSPWGSIRSTVGVGTLICFGDTPAVVPLRIINDIKARQDEKGMVRLHDGCSFKSGDRVKIVDGPLNDFEGLFECLTDNDRVTVLLNLLGREVKVRTPLETVFACA